MPKHLDRGAGGCLGRFFGMLELQLVVATMAPPPAGQILEPITQQEVRV
ncbi:MAG: hypothetical protein GY719_14570 [bacterium]|nr:hypothetical protein [bacterium]